MQIQTALDWQEVATNLRNDLHRLGYNPDLKKMFNNLQFMVTELSKLEVTLRRTGKFEMLDDRVAEINKAIDHFEKLLLMANLMK